MSTAEALTQGSRAEAAGAHTVGLHKWLVAFVLCGGVVAQLHQPDKMVSIRVVIQKAWMLL